MSVWLELHCDARKDGRTPTGEPSCWAHNGQQPGIMVSNIKLSRSYNSLAQVAKEKGFVRMRGVGWVCPSCQKRMADPVASGDHA